MTSSKDLTPDAALFLPSIWTPWAAILCLHCHGPKTPNGAAVPDYDEALKPRKRRDDGGARPAIAVRPMSGLAWTSLMSRIWSTS